MGIAEEIRVSTKRNDHFSAVVRSIAYQTGTGWDTELGIVVPGRIWKELGACT